MARGETPVCANLWPNCKIFVPHVHDCRDADSPESAPVRYITYRAVKTMTQRAKNA